jgi:hypothetical protein
LGLERLATSPKRSGLKLTPSPMGLGQVFVPDLFFPKKESDRLKFLTLNRQLFELPLFPEGKSGFSNVRLFSRR